MDSAIDGDATACAPTACDRVRHLACTLLPTEKLARPWQVDFAFADSATGSAGVLARVSSSCRTPPVDQASSNSAPTRNWKLIAIDADRAIRVHGRWPQHRPDRWCDHCCHAFDPPGVPLPLAYNARTDVFTVRGAFCSFACAKAHNFYARNAYPNMPVVAAVLTLFHKRCTGRLEIVRAAPPRNALRVFGGWMTIDEFREAHDVVDVNLLPPKMILQEQLAEARAKTAATAAAAVPAAVKSEAVQYTAELPRNETLRLKRHKPLHNKNALGRLGFLR